MLPLNDARDGAEMSGGGAGRHPPRPVTALSTSSAAESILMDETVLHDDAELVFGVRNKIDILERVSIDDQDVG